MSEERTPPEDGANGPRRESWSLRTIVMDLSGHSLEEYQDPERQPHPYLRVKPPPGAEPAPPHLAPHGAGRRATAGRTVEETADPVGRVYPPLTGAVGRALHGPEEEHDAATLAAAAPAARPSSPSRRPERVYLHYLLLHIDRLSDHALRYLRHAVDEELAHRDSVREPPRE
jgi:hypothetical protein